MDTDQHDPMEETLSYQLDKLNQQYMDMVIYPLIRLMVVILRLVNRPLRYLTGCDVNWRAPMDGSLSYQIEEFNKNWQEFLLVIGRKISVLG